MKRPPKVLSALLLVLLLAGSIARVIGHPLEAATPPKKTATNSDNTNPPLPTNFVTSNGHRYNVELATTDSQKALGLSNRSSLDDNAGMLFVFNPPSRPSFWMKDMKFNLDIVWIADGRIIAVDRNVPAPVPGTKQDELPNYLPPSTINYVLELKAGQATELSVGDEAIVASPKSI